jgi:hypothetical protein
MPHPTSSPEAATRPQPYLRVPDRLLRSYPHDPLGVGVYIVVARYAITASGAVPLSAADLVAWSGEAHSRASVIRRMRSLIDAGWLIDERSGNTKLRLLPTWGHARDGRSRPWRLRDPQLGRPAEIQVRRVPLDLLDVYIGRLDPQPGRRAAVVTRYFDRPLIDLADLGAYAIALAADVRPTERLLGLSLADSSGPLTPATLSSLLTASEASTLRLTVGGVTTLIRPSAFGRRRLATHAEEGSSSCEAPSGSRSESQSESPSDSPSASRSNSVSESGSEAPSDSAPILLILPSRRASRSPMPGVREQREPYAWDSRDSTIKGCMDSLPPPRTSPAERGRAGRSQPSQTDESPTSNAKLDATLRAMGIRHPRVLAGVDKALVRRWQEALAHPGLATRFADPVAFAVTQMRHGSEPPEGAILAHWLVTGSTNLSQSAGQHIEPPESTCDDEHHAELLARARAIAPPNATPADLALLLQALTNGASDEAAVAELKASAASDEAATQDEEVYRALIARSARR